MLPPWAESHIVVVDNEAEPNNRGLVEAFAARCPFPVHYIHEPRRGIPQARNAVVAKCRDLNVDWIAFTDDDCWASPIWLESLISQDVFLFDGTIRDNIRAGRPEASEEEFAAAARAAHADAFIRALPNGYDTPVGELGGQVSGGQRQRIALARAFLKDAPVVLLDEPTSALDSEMEGVIQRALDELSEGRTTLVIAHRLATVLRADLVHVVDDGRVVESGSHRELIQAGGAYARLHRLQFEAESGHLLAV